MEEMLYDRISFRRFCGFALNAKIPDETTLCRFRGALGNQTGKLFDLVMEELMEKGIKLSGGTIIDATVIESSVRPPCGGEVSEKDPGAGWTVKNKKYIHGYKGHVASDKETGLIKRIIGTSADVHDSQVFGQLLDGSEEEVYADKAYGSQKNRDLLEEHGIGDRLMHKARRGKGLSWFEKMLNSFWGKTRSAVERIFGHFKTGMGLRGSRYKGVEKHQVHFDLMAIAYNLRRATVLLSI